MTKLIPLLAIVFALLAAPVQAPSASDVQVALGPMIDGGGYQLALGPMIDGGGYQLALGPMIDGGGCQIA